MQVQLCTLQVKFVYQGHRIKVKVTLANSVHCVYLRFSITVSYVAWLDGLRRVGANSISVWPTDLYKYSPDAVPSIHAVSYHVATDKPPAQNGDKFRSIFSDNLQPIATRGKKARGTLLVDKHCGNGCSMKRALLSVSYYNEISGGHIGRAVVRRRCSAGPVLPMWCDLLADNLPLLERQSRRQFKHCLKACSSDFRVAYLLDFRQSV